MRMRVIAGARGGRWFSGDVGARSHPMGERIRGALFNSLGNLHGKTVLDAFSGTGAFAFEAASRGSYEVVATERDRRAQKVIQTNIEDLDLQNRVKLVKAGAGAWSGNNPKMQFDIVLCDPPYNDMQLSTVAKLVRHIKPDGLMVLSYPGRESTPTVNGVVVVDTKLYGDAALAYYRLD